MYNNYKRGHEFERESGRKERDSGNPRRVESEKRQGGNDANIMQPCMKFSN